MVLAGVSHEVAVRRRLVQQRAGQAPLPLHVVSGPPVVSLCGAGLSSLTSQQPRALELLHRDSCKQGFPFSDLVLKVTGHR